MMVVITSVGECVIPYPHRRTNKTRITLPPKPPSRVGVHQITNWCTPTQKLVYTNTKISLTS